MKVLRTSAMPSNMIRHMAPAAALHISCPHARHNQKVFSDLVSSISSNGKKDKEKPSIINENSKKEDDPSNNIDINNLSPEMSRRLKILEMEYLTWQSFGRSVPEKMTDTEWLQILKHYDTVSDRIRYYRFLHELEEDNKLMDYMQHVAPTDNQAVDNKVNCDEDKNKHKETYLLRPTRSDRDKIYYNNCYHAMLHGPRVVFDVSFDSHMNPIEHRQLVSQIKKSIEANRKSRQPFDFHLCGLQEKGHGEHFLNLAIPKLHQMPVTVSRESVFELFPKEKLVYLSYNPLTTLTEYNPQDIYIIGGIVDTPLEKPKNLCYPQAKKLGIRTAKLPLDTYLM